MTRLLSIPDSVLKSKSMIGHMPVLDLKFFDRSDSNLTKSNLIQPILTNLDHGKRKIEKTTRIH